MDVNKIQGILDAIEAESKAPSPSHNNLARLVALFIKELIIKTEVVEPIPPKIEETKIQQEENNVPERHIRKPIRKTKGKSE